MTVSVHKTALSSNVHMITTNITEICDFVERIGRVAKAVISDYGTFSTANSSANSEFTYSAG